MKLKGKWMVRCVKKNVLNSKVQKRKVIRVESEETQDYVCETLAISQEEAEEMGFVPSALSEPRGPVGATIDAVKKPSDTGRLRQWWLMKVEKPTQSICVSSAATNS